MNNLAGNAMSNKETRDDFLTSQDIRNAKNKLNLNYSYRNNNDCISTAILLERWKKENREFVLYSKLPGETDIFNVVELGDFLIVLQVIKN